MRSTWGEMVGLIVFFALTVILHTAMESVKKKRLERQAARRRHPAGRRAIPSTVPEEWYT